MIRKIFIQIKRNGITPGLSLENKLNIEISNVFNIMFVFLIIPFIVVFNKTPMASLVTATPVVAFISSFLLIRYHYYNLGRLVFSITTPTTIYFIAALLYCNSGTDGMAAKFLLIGDVMLPFIVFSKKEWHFIVLILVIDLFYLVSFNYTNSILNIPNIHDVDTAELRLISILTVFVMFAVFFFYYKVILTNSLQKVDEANRKLILRNKKLTELNATKNKLFSIVSHDLRGPMCSIVGFAEILHQNNHNLGKDDLKEFTETFYKTSKNTYRILENLLSWSRSQMDCIKLNIQEFELQEFVAETLNYYSYMARQKEVKIINKVRKDIYVKADKDIAHCVLQNLISNAIKYSYPNNSVTVTMEKTGLNTEEFISISVNDNGTGMDSETISDLFKIEKTNSLSGTNNEQGTGLGLILCKELAELNQGDISVNSEQGKGTTISFTLPFSKIQFAKGDEKREGLFTPFF